MRYHLTPIRMTILQKITNVGKDIGKRETLYTVGWNINWCNYYGKVYRFLKILKIELTYYPSISTAVYMAEENKTVIKKDTGTLIFVTTLFTIGKYRSDPNIN